MQFTNLLAVAILLAGSAFAAPAADANAPPKPVVAKPGKPTTTTVSQSNSCGNGATSYCCNTDELGAYTTCVLLLSGDTCSATTVCCNAENSVQVCLGRAQIL